MKLEEACERMRNCVDELGPVMEALEKLVEKYDDIIGTRSIILRFPDIDEFE